MSKTRRGRVVAFHSHFGSGIAIIVIEDGEGTRRQFPCEEGATWRALISGFALGKEVAYEVDPDGTLGDIEPWLKGDR